MGEDSEVLLVGTASVKVVVVWLERTESVVADVSVELAGSGADEVNVDDLVDNDTELGEVEELDGWAFARSISNGSHKRYSVTTDPALLTERARNSSMMYQEQILIAKKKWHQYLY